jgi:hypothetical protein
MRAEWRKLGPQEQARHLGRAGAPALGVRLKTDTDSEILARTNHALDRYWRDGAPRRGVRDQRPGVRGRLPGAHFHR